MYSLQAFAQAIADRFNEPHPREYPGMLSRLEAENGKGDNILGP